MLQEKRGEDERWTEANLVYLLCREMFWCQIHGFPLEGH